MLQRLFFVGNLSYETEKDSLYAEFESCGQIVDVRVITDKTTGRSRGLVTFSLQIMLLHSKDWN